MHRINGQTSMKRKKKTGYFIIRPKWSPEINPTSPTPTPTGVRRVLLQFHAFD